jgi:hypothetical protein
MTDRWRGRSLAGPVLVAVLAVLTAGVALGARAPVTRWVVVRDPAGVELARAQLPPSAELALSYRNSIYHSLAQEHYRVIGDHLELVGLEADELAVLEEYSNAYGAVRDAPGAALRWSVAVDRPPVALPLSIRATELGERTLIVDGRATPLWQLIAGRDDSLVILSVEPGE